MDEVSGLSDFWKEFSSLGQEVDHFATARLFDGTPAVWPQELSYIKWRHLVATELGVDPMAVQLAGSARLGYSMNPKKNFRKFHEGSDLDIAIISSELFDKAWGELQEIIEGDSTLSRERRFESSWTCFSVQCRQGSEMARTEKPKAFWNHWRSVSTCRTRKSRKSSKRTHRVFGTPLTSAHAGFAPSS